MEVTRQKTCQPNQTYTSEHKIQTFISGDRKNEKVYLSKRYSDR